MNDIKIAANKTRLVAEANMRAARAIRALEQAQHDADRANEAVNRAREEAKSAQHVAEESLAALKAMLCDEQAATDTPRTETARIDIEADTSGATTAAAAIPTTDVQEEVVLRISTIKREGQHPLVVVMGKLDYLDLFNPFLFDLFDPDKINRLANMGRRSGKQ